MLTSVEAVVEKGQIKLLEAIPLPEGTRLVIWVMPEEPDRLISPRHPGMDWFNALKGLGREIWLDDKGELIDPDEYVSKLREGWD